MNLLRFLAELLRLVALLDAIERLPLPRSDRAAIGRLVAMLPSRELGASLRAVDASHAELHGAGAGQRPADGRDVYERAMVYRTMRALGAGR